MATKKDFEVFRGDSRKITINFSSNAESMVTGGRVWMTVKNKKGDADVDAVYQVDVPITVDGDGKGQAVINILPADTNVLLIKKYYQDIQLVGANPAELVKTLVEGGFKVLQDVTRSTT